jgi:hypothetical protein
VTAGKLFLCYLDLFTRQQYYLAQARSKGTKSLPDQNLSKVSRELPTNVLLCVSKLHAGEKGSYEFCISLHIQ